MLVPSLAIRQAATGALKDFVNAFPLPNGPDLPGGGSIIFATTYRLRTATAGLDRGAQRHQ